MKAEAGILETDSPAEALEKLGHVADLVDDEADRAWITARLAPLVGAQDEVAGVGREEAFSAWRRYLEALAADRPTILVLEDIHWADTRCSTSWSTSSTGPRTPHSWSLPPPGRSSTTRGLAGAGAAATRRRSVSPRCPTRTRCGWSPLCSSGRSCRRRHRLLFSSAPAETPCTRSSSCGCSGRVAPRDGLPETVQALIAARLDTLAPELKSLLHECVRSREGVLGRRARRDGSSRA